MSKGKFNLEEIQKEWNQQDPTIPIPEDLSCLKKQRILSKRFEKCDD